ncbi:phosphodiester glycosidase family protein [Marimonas arenosa]|uniref:Phosphodiester glycosidase family protein n=1 Tax=Marimonas arenosa TaxID=1795305 RepID=A0AAE3WBS0_9RHOB|nr:phosphodiester glycosidase family protein [Marimonas arenosa]MDQ2089505.1 phosphodiester glycosidase family protein [Marimonas arenosa]
MRRLAVLVLATLPAAAAWAVECRDIAQNTNRFTVCEADAAREDLRLFLLDKTGTVYASFARIETDLAASGDTLAFAMNAGMYHASRAPVGYYLEDGKELQRLVTSDGPGNFGLLPNGVFCIRDGRADVIETGLFDHEKPACSHASQSGPMLVIDGNLHPRFLKDSTSRYVRNGVGTSADGQRVVFAISNNPVTFHEFGRLYRDLLKLPQALYFDGNVSRLHAPGLGRSDPGFAMGPIVGVVAPAAGN